MKLKKKKLTQAEIAEFEIKELIGIAIVFVVLIIIVAYAQQITGDVASDMDDNSYEKNATLDGQEALDVIPNKSKTLITVIMASAIIGTLMIYLYYRFMKN